MANKKNLERAYLEVDSGHVTTLPEKDRQRQSLVTVLGVTAVFVWLSFLTFVVFFLYLGSAK